MGTPSASIDDQVLLDKRLSLLEQSVNNGFAQLRLDLRNVLDEMSRRDEARQRQIEALEAKDARFQEEMITLRTEVALLKHQMGMISKISLAALLTVVGLIIERIVALL